MAARRIRTRDDLRAGDKVRHPCGGWWEYPGADREWDIDEPFWDGDGTLTCPTCVLDHERDARGGWHLMTRPLRQRSADEHVETAVPGVFGQGQPFAKLPDAFWDGCTALDVGAHDQLVLLALWRRQKFGGVCSPSYDTIAADAKLARTTVVKTVQRLRKAGLVDITPSARVGRKQAPNTYDLTPFWLRVQQLARGAAQTAPSAVRERSRGDLPTSGERSRGDLSSVRERSPGDREVEGEQQEGELQEGPADAGSGLRPTCPPSFVESVLGKLTDAETRIEGDAIAAVEAPSGAADRTAPPPASLGELVAEPANCGSEGEYDAGLVAVAVQVDEPDGHDVADEQEDQPISAPDGWNPDDDLGADGVPVDDLRRFDEAELKRRFGRQFRRAVRIRKMQLREWGPPHIPRPLDAEEAA